MRELGAAVREERRKRKLTMRELASMTGTSPSTICRLETGKVMSQSKNIKKILAALDISTDDANDRISRIIAILQKAANENEDEHYLDDFSRGLDHGICFALALLTGEVSLEAVEHCQLMRKDT